MNARRICLLSSSGILAVVLSVVTIGCHPYTPPPGNTRAYKSTATSSSTVQALARSRTTDNDKSSARREAIRPPVPNPYFRTNTVNVTTRRRQAILYKLKTITFEEIHLDEIPLSEVIRYLNSETKRLDPDKQGVNFLLLSPAATDGVSIVVDGPNAGAVPDPFGPAAPIAAGEARVIHSVDLENVVIDIDPPLRDLPLVYVLDAIAKKADSPIQFAVLDYAVVIMPKSPGQTDRFFRSFRANGDIFQQGLQGVQCVPFNGVGSSQ